MSALPGVTAVLSMKGADNTVGHAEERGHEGSVGRGSALQSSPSSAMSAASSAQPCLLRLLGPVRACPWGGNPVIGSHTSAPVVA